MNGTIDSSNTPTSEGSSSSSQGPARDLGEYRLLKRLGAGGMGRVYKAMHRRLEKLVAVKLLPVYHADDPAALARFDREIKAIGRVSHPNVVQAFDAQEIAGTHFLAMEYVDGANLSLLVRTLGPLPIADACELGRQAASGLQCAHEHGLVHRDIKPSNLMLSRAGQLKILDLGLARFRAEPVGTEEMTDLNATLGTAEYISPEQAMDSHRVDIRADIYSLGCTMFRLLTGQPPFFGPKYRSAMEKMMAHLKEPCPSIREARGEVSEPLAAIMGRMMAKDPDRRFATPAEVAAALAPHAAGSDLPELMRRFDAANPAAASPQAASAMPAVADCEAASGAEADALLPLPRRDSPRPSSLRPTASSARFLYAAAAVVVLVLVGAIAFPWRSWRPGAARNGTTATGPVSPSPPDRDSCGTELPQDQWVDVLPCTDLDRDRVGDYWEARKDGIGCRGTSGYPRISLPVAVHGDYDLEVVCTRNSGGGLIRILFPVGDANMPQLLLASGDGTLYGFNEFNGHGRTDPENSSAWRLDPLVNGRPYKVSISVRLHGGEATIDVLLDGRPLCHCTAAPSSFPAYHFVDPFEQVRPVVGVAAGSDATFQSARVRLAGGKGAIKRRRFAETCPRGQWIDLLPLFDIARDRISGGLARNGGGLRIAADAHAAVVMFPAALQGSYDLEIEFTPEAAPGMISFVVPVGPRRVRVNPTVTGELHPDPASINRPEPISEDGRDNAPRDELRAGVRHVLLLTVGAEGDSAAIDVRVDGKPWLSWSGPQAELNDGPIILAESDRLGLVAGGAVTLHAARLRVTSGKGRLLVSEPAGQRQ